MKTLLILRHAKSGMKRTGMTDHDRPLAERGERDAPHIGQLLASEGLVPDAILCSSATRARATAEAVARACGFGGEITLNAPLYLAAPTPYLEALSLLPDTVARAMVVGHNPGLEELLEQLTGRYHTMPTAALAHVELPVERWDALTTRTRGTLRGFWRPADL